MSDEKKGLHSVCYFQGATPQAVSDQLLEYGPSTARLFILTDDPELAAAIRKAQHAGAKLYTQVKAETGEGGDPNDEAHPCPGSPGC